MSNKIIFHAKPFTTPFARPANNIKKKKQVLEGCTFSTFVIVSVEKGKCKTGMFHLLGFRSIRSETLLCSSSVRIPVVGIAKWCGFPWYPRMGPDLNTWAISHAESRASSLRFQNSLLALSKLEIGRIKLLERFHVFLLKALSGYRLLELGHAIK